MERISLDTANQVIASAFDHGREHALKPLAAIVVDAGGHPIAFQRQDGCSTHRLQVAAGKACGALAMGMSSRGIAQIAAERPFFIAALGPMLPFGPVPAAGGVIVIDQAGMAIGAVAVTGDTGDNDERCSLAAIASVGLVAQPNGGK